MTTLTFGQINAIVSRHQAAEATASARPAILTPRGRAVCALIREGWLRDVAPNDREPAIYGLCVAIPGITPEDRHYLVDLVAAHQGPAR